MRTPPHPTLLTARRAAPALFALTLLVGLLSGASIASAAGSCVNPGGTGSCSSSINAAIAAAAPGSTITIQHGTYAENVVVTKSVTLQGDDRPVIYPAVSDPNCGGAGGGSLCPGASNIILVQADNVTVAGLVLDGDNPHLHSGVLVGGADLDARNGIITNHAMGVFNNLNVHDVTVRDVYLRGIYASSGGTFNLSGNTVTNVQANPASIGIFNFGGGGVMANNEVSDANDAISANHSNGTRFLNNTIRHSGSGVHTDNAGDGGGTADLIQGNTVRDCTKGGYGIFSFVTYFSPTFRDNTVSKCDVAMAAFGSGLPSTTTFLKNQVTGTGAAGTVGAYVTTDEVGFGDSDVSVSLLNNSIKGFEIGVQVIPTNGKTATVTMDHTTIDGSDTGVDVAGPARFAPLPAGIDPMLSVHGGPSNVSIANSCITHNDTGLFAHDGGTLAAHQSQIAHNKKFGANNTNSGVTPPINATSNWWGAKSGPAPAGKGDKISAGVMATPFLTASPVACGGDGSDGGGGGSDGGGGGSSHPGDD